VLPTAGSIGAAAWLRSLGQVPPTTTRWFVEVAMATGEERPPLEFDPASETRFHVNVYGEEWGVFVCCGGRSSWLRVTDIAFVHGRDDFSLLAMLPALHDVGQLLRHVETRLALTFRRDFASVRTNLAGVEPAVRAWVTAF
jgi:hypothetical protein